MSAGSLEIGGGLALVWSRIGFGLVGDGHWIGRFVMDWSYIGIELWEFIRDWYWIGHRFEDWSWIGNRLVCDWQIGPGLTLDWQIGRGLAVGV